MKSRVLLKAQIADDRMSQASTAVRAPFSTPYSRSTFAAHAKQQDEEALRKSQMKKKVRTTGGTSYFNTVNREAEDNFPEATYHTRPSTAG